MRVHLYASLPHYAEHLQPIWNALPDHVRGEAWSPRSSCWWGDPLPHPRRQADGLVLVAGYADARKMSARHELIYVEHGAGQSYDGDPIAIGNGSYSGGVGLDRVRLFICPSQQVSQRWAARYDTPAAVVGCPKLDRWHAAPIVKSAELRVAVTFHWDCPLVPETTSSVRYYEPALAALRDAVRAAGGELLGHGHPRAWSALRAVWNRLGVPHTAHLSDVLDSAHMLIGDNSSALYEFASLDRPVVVLNAPWYRRDVEHGLRFWTHVPGVQVDDRAQLAETFTAALLDPPELRTLRSRAVEHVYRHRDGRAAERAAAAIVEVISAEPEGSPTRASTQIV